MNKLQLANLSYGIVLIPTEPIFSNISEASLKITENHKNYNIIDNKIFPTHLSVILTGTNREHSNIIFQKLQETTSEFKCISLTANNIYLGKHGYIGVKCNDNSKLKNLCHKIISTCASFHQKHQVFRPHIIKRWDTLQENEKKLIIEYGTYKLFNNMDFHLSVAMVDSIDQDECFKIAKNTINIPQTFKIEKFQFVDIGHENEKWEVLYEW